MRIQNLIAGYGNNIVIKNFSLNINPGDRLIIAGPNGCGKTTLLRCILGILKPKSGKIIIEKNEKIAYCKQDFPNTQFPITVQEVVAMGIDKKVIGKWHKSSVKRDFISQIENALKKADALYLKNRLFYDLSGGERQKVSLARCYCQNASIILLDEPTSFLDSDSRINFLQQMRNLEKENFAIIAVTHDEEIINKLGMLGWKTVRGETWNA